MKQGHFEEHWKDAEGRPAGGVSTGLGFTISWQNGLLGRGNQRRKPNGAFVEDVLQAVIGRLNAYQKSPFACDENATALEHLECAAAVLDARTQRREQAGTEGTHSGS